MNEQRQRNAGVGASPRQQDMIEAVMQQDREVFRINPELQEFTRRAVPAEMPRGEYRPGMLCTVTYLSSGIRQRVFHAPGTVATQDRRAGRNSGRR